MRARRCGVAGLRVLAVVAVVGMVASVTPAIGAPRAAAVESVGTVTVDQPLYWEVEVATTSPLTEMCGIDVCRQWSFNVPEIPAGHRLRVAFDHDDNLNSYAWRVRKPTQPEVL